MGWHLDTVEIYIPLKAFFCLQMTKYQQIPGFMEMAPVQFFSPSKESCVLANPVPVQCQKYSTWMFWGWQYWQDLQLKTV